LKGNVISTQVQFYYEFTSPGIHLITLDVFDGEISVSTKQIINVIDIQRKHYDLMLFQTSKELVSTCSSCHDDGILHITDHQNLRTLATYLKDCIASRSAMLLINVSSETNGVAHSGYRFMAGQGRFADANKQLSRISSHFEQN